MTSKLTGILKEGNAGDRIAARVGDYERLYGGAARGGLDERKADYRNVERTSYDLVTAFFELGWGQSFYFSPDKVGVYDEAFRLLKPGGCFAAYEYCLTGRFDAADPDHLRLKADIEYGGALPNIARPDEVDGPLREVGFELIDARDPAAEAPPEIPWHQPFIGSGLSFASLRSSPVGRRLTSSSIWLLERLGIVPRGAARVLTLLNLAAATFAEAGCLGIFTPMYFFLARKPE